MLEIHYIYAVIWPQLRIPRKNTVFGSLGGGDHSRTQKVKTYNKNIAENRIEKSGDDFPIKSLGNPQFSMISFKSTKKLCRNTDMHKPGSTKIGVRTNSARQKFAGPTAQGVSDLKYGLSGCRVLYFEGKKCTPRFFYP